MVLMKRLTWRSWAGYNLLLGLILVNLWVFGPALEMGKAFTAGLLTGVATGWLLFSVSGAIALRRKAPTFDERRQAAYLKASAFAFWLLILVASLAVLALRSERLGIELEAYELATLLANLGLGSFGLAWLVIERRS